MSASSELEFLKSLLEEATAPLPHVQPKRLFGCDGFFAAGNIFAMVWKDGRIGLKIPDETLYAELRGMKGAEPWTPGGKMVMTKWVLVPEGFHDDTDALSDWTRKAHALALAKPVTEKKKSGSAKKGGVKKGGSVKKAASVKKGAGKKRSS